LKPFVALATGSSCHRAGTGAEPLHFLFYTRLIEYSIFLKFSLPSIQIGRRGKSGLPLNRNSLDVQAASALSHVVASGFMRVSMLQVQRSDGNTSSLPARSKRRRRAWPGRSASKQQGSHPPVRQSQNLADDGGREAEKPTERLAFDSFLDRPCKQPTTAWCKPAVVFFTCGREERLVRTQSLICDCR